MADNDVVVEILVDGCFFITVITGIGYMPIRLKANDEKITVRRLFGSREILLSEVTGVSRISKSDLSGSVQTFGSGGFIRVQHKKYRESV